jgi:TRAP-type C4-dicarboxylate transport system permease small subunit
MNENETAGEAFTASSALGKLLRGLVRLGGILSAFLIIVALGVVSYSVFQRYVLDTPLLWGDEFIGYLLVAIVMLGAAEALRKGDHIGIDLLTGRAGPKLARFLALWADVAVLIFSFVLGWSSWKAIEFAKDFGEYSSGYIEIQTWIAQIPLLIGSTLLGIVALTRILDKITSALRS